MEDGGWSDGRWSDDLPADHQMIWCGDGLGNGHMISNNVWSHDLAVYYLNNHGSGAMMAESGGGAHPLHSW